MPALSVPIRTESQSSSLIRMADRPQDKAPYYVPYGSALHMIASIHSHEYNQIASTAYGDVNELGALLAQGKYKDFFGKQDARDYIIAEADRRTNQFVSEWVMLTTQADNICHNGIEKESILNDFYKACRYIYTYELTCMCEQVIKEREQKEKRNQRKDNVVRDGGVAFTKFAIGKPGGIVKDASERLARHFDPYQEIYERLRLLRHHQEQKEEPAVGSKMAMFIALLAGGPLAFGVITTGVVVNKWKAWQDSREKSKQQEEQAINQRKAEQQRLQSEREKQRVQEVKKVEQLQEECKVLEKNIGGFLTEQKLEAQLSQAKKTLEADKVFLAGLLQERQGYEYAYGLNPQVAPTRAEKNTQKQKGASFETLAYELVHNVPERIKELEALWKKRKPEYTEIVRQGIGGYEPKSGMLVAYKQQLQAIWDGLTDAEAELAEGKVKEGRKGQLRQMVLTEQKEHERKQRIGWTKNPIDLEPYGKQLLLDMVSSQLDGGSSAFQALKKDNNNDPSLSKRVL